MRCKQIVEMYETLINQIKHNPGVMFGSSETTPGGSALRFYASLRL